MVKRSTDEPPLMRALSPKPLRPGAIGGVEPIMPRTERDRTGIDWGLVLITVAFLGGAGGLVYFGYLANRPPESLAAGETRIITARPETVIPDAPGSGATGAAPTADGASADTPGSGYSMEQNVTGGDVATRPGAHTAPEPAGRRDERPRSVAPGTLQAPPGVKPAR